MERTCKQCEATFQHEQKGRGRPPVYCASCREARQQKPKRGKVGRPPKKDRGELVRLDGEIRAGDTVIRPLLNFFRNQETSIKYATPLRVTAILGETAYVQHPEEPEPLATSISRLLKVGQQ